ncbi:hypothetical protein DFJ74DRAFT_103624 [Hyaloraphidium curvatum]|nr:hypothetical protein DFJ74DRAFT_103624 [Hyaloraphidium curvatum]
MPIADTVCDASGSYTIRSQARCADQTGTLVSVTGVDCSATRDFPFTLSATGLCDRLNQTLSIVGAMLLPIKPRFAVNETVALTFNLLYPDAVWQGFAGNVTFERLVVESVKNGENFTLVDDSAKTAVVDEIEFSVDGKPYTSNMYFDALLNPTIRFRPNIAVGGLIKPNQIYDVNLGFRVYLEFNIDWNRLVNGWQKRSFSIRQMMAPLTPGGVEAEFGIIPLTPTTTQPIVTEPGSPLPPWIPPVIIIVTVISVINSIAGTVGGFSGILAAVSSPTLSHGSNKDGPVSQTLDSSYITKTVPGLIDWVQYTQTIVITGALGLDTADIYPIFVSTMLWLFGIFKVGLLCLWTAGPDPPQFLNPLAEVIYADGLAYGDTMDIAALYKRDGITPSYYGIERVALASGVRPRNVFLIIFLSFLIFEAAVAVLALAAGFACRIAMHYKPSARLHRLHELLPSLWLGTSLRVWNLYYTPIALGVAYQIALACRPELRIPIQVTVIAGFAALAVGLMVPGAVVWYTARTQPKEMLFDRTKLLASLGPLYNTYQPQLLMFFAAVIVYKLAIGIVAGAAYRFVWVQLAVLASFEVGYMLSVAGLKPHSSRARNFFELALSVLRLANLGLLCASVAGLGVSEQAKTATETASIVLQLCVAVGMGLVMLWSLLAKIMRWLWSTAKVAPAEVALVPGKGEMEEREPVSSPVPSPQTADGPAIGAGAEAGTHERRPRRSDRPNGGTRATSSAVLV